MFYEIKWGMSYNIWRYLGKNIIKYVEINFIEKFILERYLRLFISCFIVWFLFWSFCWECFKVIREFLS